jgi:formylglycine-generating enzyme required for sulfatase activity
VTGHARVELDWVTVPGGVFAMGSDSAGAYPPDADEAPRHAVPLDAFRITRTPVTNDRYAAFVAATAGRRAPCHWPGEAPADGSDDQPVTYVTWDDARAFCAWVGGRLPTEAEWERAARGDDARLWPWGDQPPDASMCTFATSAGPPPVGSTPAGASPWGVLDLAGTVWEWTSTVYCTYPYDAGDGREEEAERGARVVRGGSFIHEAGDIRCSSRQGVATGARDHYVGFRVVAGADPGPLGLDWVDVPAGDVQLGNDPQPFTGEVFPAEMPRHLVEVEPFELTRTPVTNAQYAAFIGAGGEPPPHWDEPEPPPGLGSHPVTHVDWNDARAFCTWAGGRLPTEVEWERAARGDDMRTYPWGAKAPAPELLAVGLGLKHGSTAPVDAHPRGASPYGLLEMAGNVWEWVSSAFRPYPYLADDGREDQDGGEPRVLRGGSYASPDPSYARCASRSRSHICRRQAHIGFRVARGGGSRA